MGVEGRSDDELKAQGYILFCAHQGDAVGAWAKGIFRAAALKLPIWIIGYAPTLPSDTLEVFRSEWIKDFLKYKEQVITFAYRLYHDDDKETLDIIKNFDEDKFQIRLAGFMPQYSQVDPKSSPHLGNSFFFIFRPDFLSRIAFSKISIASV